MRQPHTAQSYAAHAPRSVEGYAGNQAMLRRLSPTSPHLQCKLEIGAVNVPLEAEADRVADEVMRLPDPALSSEDGPEIVRRKCVTCEEEDKKLRKKSTEQEQDGFEAPPIVHDVLGSSGQSLDTAARAFFEPRFGADFSSVRVHSDAVAAKSAEAVSALAYTFGRQIVLGAGASHGTNPLLAHELAHVVQQKGGHTRAQRSALSSSRDYFCAVSRGASLPGPARPSVGKGRGGARVGG